MGQKIVAADELFIRSPCLGAVEARRFAGFGGSGQQQGQQARDDGFALQRFPRGLFLRPSVSPRLRSTNSLPACIAATRLI